VLPRVCLTHRKRSKNRKTHGLTVSLIQSRTCPPACPLKASNACYHRHGPMYWTWQKLDRGEIGMPWNDFLRKVETDVEPGEPWRYGVGGDLPGDGNVISAVGMRGLIRANRGRRGFGFTHKPLTERNVRLIMAACSGGFLVNVSCDTLREVDEAKRLNPSLPCAVLLPRDADRAVKTPNGHVVIPCPGECVSCGWCWKPNRRFVPGFPAHGAAFMKADRIAKGGGVT
jgi:hypothetical protein